MIIDLKTPECGSRLLLICAAVLSLGGAADAQRPRPAQDLVRQSRTASYLELLGAGGFYSLNIERISPAENLLRFGFTTGATTNFDNITNGERALIATVGRVLRVSIPGGPPDGPIEIGGGVVVGEQWRHQSGNNREEGGYAALVGALGVRSRREGRGVMWRLTFTPFLNFSAHNDNSHTGLQPHLGGSLGWIF